APFTATVGGRGPARPGAPAPAFSVTRNLMHVDVDASASTDPENDITTYAWDFENDGTFDVTGASPIAVHDYTVARNYTIRLRVTDATSNQASTTRRVTVAPSTIDYEFYDFFDVEFGEWWDYRFNSYGDLPINAECFNATSIATGVCTPSTPAPDTSSYPYTNWYPAPGSIVWNNPNANPLIYAPYRFRVTAANVGGYNASEPVFLPVLDYGEAPGTAPVSFDWRMQYLDTAAADALDLQVCGISSFDLDGFQINSTIQLTMDLQESRRLFGVVAADAAAAQAWWTANTDPRCFFRGAVEDRVVSWFVALAGDQSNLGKYDISNSFEYYYVPYFLDMNATVDTDGTTHVTIRHVAWGTDVLVSRMFYWGNVTYADPGPDGVSGNADDTGAYLDSTKAAGWWGMELAWFEDFVFTGSLDATGVDFALSSVMQYHFQQTALPGADGFLNRVDDIPVWTWGPVLTDYANDWSPRHQISELDRYPDTSYSYLHSTPGGSNYNDTLKYETVPIRWDLAAGQTWRFQFPTGNVVFYDPNLTPVPAQPNAASYVEISAPLQFLSTKPASFGASYDTATRTWELLGPTSTGGPVGSPGADGVPGTADDEYALEPWGAISFVPGPSSAPALAGTGEPSAGARPMASVTPGIGWSPQALVGTQRLRGSRSGD
ncbi:MAG: PKD domain-containing protein, partial [Methanobacteriota archaeon]